MGKTIYSFSAGFANPNDCTTIPGAGDNTITSRPENKTKKQLALLLHVSLHKISEKQKEPP